MGLPESISGVALSDVLLRAAGNGTSDGPAELDLIKMDADGPEGGWLDEIEALLSARRLRVRHMLIEGSHLRPYTMSRLQQVGLSAARSAHARTHAHTPPHIAHAT